MKKKIGLSLQDFLNNSEGLSNILTKRNLLSITGGQYANYCESTYVRYQKPIEPIKIPKSDLTILRPAPNVPDVYDKVNK